MRCRQCRAEGYALLAVTSALVFLTAALVGVWFIAVIGVLG